MKILSIDPGSQSSGWMLFDSNTQKILLFGKTENETFLKDMEYLKPVPDILVYEKMQNYGSPVGQTTFDTCIWIGRFIQKHIDIQSPFQTPRVGFVYRYEVKSNLCPKMRSNDSTIRAALIERFGKQGSKRNPGPTYGVKADIWSALGIAVTFGDKGVN